LDGSIPEVEKLRVWIEAAPILGEMAVLESV
jgi:hypothetical protein